MTDLSKFNTATMEDILRDPEKYGAPTFEQFKKNREKYMGKPDSVLDTVDKGSNNLRGLITKHRYFINGYEAESLEDLERIARDYGIYGNIEYAPEVVPVPGGKAELHVKFFSKDEINGGIVGKTE